MRQDIHYFDWSLKRLLHDKANFGVLEGLEANAKSLLTNGVPMDLIVNSLHLTDEEIEKLKK